MHPSNPIIDQILETHKAVIGKQFRAYNNHVYRVFNLCLLMDESEDNIDKYAIAAAFHDIGIWTAKTFDYLEPSINLAKEYLIAQGKEPWIEEISIMIDMHHKKSRYTGVFENTVETFRRADWIEVSLGFFSYKVDKNKIADLSKTFPTHGFHWFLTKMTIKNFFKSPLNPLPMFKR